MGFYESASWEDCTSSEIAAERMLTIERECDQNWLVHVANKVRDKSIRILEVWSWDGTFMDTLYQKGFKNIRGLDMNPRHYRKFDYLDEFIDIEALWMLREPEDPFDLVCSHLVFDESVYRDQQNEGFREYMLRGIYSQLTTNWVYYASERHDKSKIRDSIEEIWAAQDTLLWIYGSELISGKK